MKRYSVWIENVDQKGRLDNIINLYAENQEEAEEKARTMMKEKFGPDAKLFKVEEE